MRLTWVVRCPPWPIILLRLSLWYYSEQTLMPAVCYDWTACPLEYHTHRGGVGGSAACLTAHCNAHAHMLLATQTGMYTRRLCWRCCQSLLAEAVAACGPHPQNTEFQLNNAMFFYSAWKIFLEVRTVPIYGWEKVCVGRWVRGSCEM